MNGKILTCSAARVSSPVRRSDVRVQSLPRLDGVVYAFLHPQRHERQSEQSVHAHGTPDDPVHDPSGQSPGVTVAQGGEGGHRRREGHEPRGDGALVHFRHGSGPWWGGEAVILGVLK